MSRFKLKLFSFMAIKWLLLTFYFELIMDLQEAAKNSAEKSRVPFSQRVPVVRSRIAAGQHQNQEVDIACHTINWAPDPIQMLPVFTCVEQEGFCAAYHVCICSCNYHHKQDAILPSPHRGPSLCCPGHRRN